MSEVRLSDIPHKAYFSFSFPIRRLREMPGLLAQPEDWDDRYALPVTSSIDRVKPFATVYAGWSENGMWVAFWVNQKQAPRPRPERFWTGDACEVWIDTRGSRDAHKPTPYCHHFYLLPDGPKASSPAIGQVPMLRSSSDRSQPDLSGVGVVRGVTDQGYAIEAFFPAEVLHGYDPHDSPVIGFCYNVCSVSMGRMHLSLSDGFRVWEDPSMWASCRLIE